MINARALKLINRGTVYIAEFICSSGQLSQISHCCPRLQGVVYNLAPPIYILVVFLISYVQSHCHGNQNIWNVWKFGTGQHSISEDYEQNANKYPLRKLFDVRPSYTLPRYSSGIQSSLFFAIVHIHSKNQHLTPAIRWTEAEKNMDKPCVGETSFGISWWHFQRYAFLFAKWND